MPTRRRSSTASAPQEANGPGAPIDDGAGTGAAAPSTPGEAAEPDSAPSAQSGDDAQSDDASADAADRPGWFSAWSPRDILVPYVLLAVSMQRAHGYLIEDYLRRLGFFGIGMSTLYRTLRQMEKDGLLVSAWESGEAGPARRVYSLTDAGRAWLDASAAVLDTYRQTIDRFFGLYGRSPGSTRTGSKERES